MNTEKQYKKFSSNIIQSKQGGRLSFIDNRLKNIITTKLVTEIQKKENGECLQRFKTYWNETPFQTDKNGNIFSNPGSRLTNVATFINLYNEFNNLGKPCKGGHLFKCEYGGQDNLQNIVPWSSQIEDGVYSKFENDYEKRLRSKWINHHNFKFITFVNYESIKNIDLENLTCFKNFDPGLKDDELPLNVVSREIYENKNRCIEAVDNALEFYTQNTNSRLVLDEPGRDSKMIIHKNIDDPGLPSISEAGLNNFFVHSKCDLNKINNIERSIRI